MYTDKTIAFFWPAAVFARISKRKKEALKGAPRVNKVATMSFQLVTVAEDTHTHTQKHTSTQIHTLYFCANMYCFVLLPCTGDCTKGQHFTVAPTSPAALPSHLSLDDCLSAGWLSSQPKTVILASGIHGFRSLQTNICVFCKLHN